METASPLGQGLCGAAPARVDAGPSSCTGGHPDIRRVVIPGKMIGKGRHRSVARKRKGGKSYIAQITPEATENMEAHVAQCFMSQCRQPTAFDAPIVLRVAILVEIPQSWSARKRHAALAGQLRPTGKPDLDNCIKLLCDALNKIAWHDDSQVVQVAASKEYTGAPPSTELVIQYLGSNA